MSLEKTAGGKPRETAEETRRYAGNQQQRLVAASFIGFLVARDRGQPQSEIPNPQSPSSASDEVEQSCRNVQVRSASSGFVVKGIFGGPIDDPGTAIDDP